MNIDDILQDIAEVARANRLSIPFMVGGVPRDRILGQRGKKSDIKDIDITTGNKDASLLAAAIARKYSDSNYQTYDDGHSSVSMSGLHIDFSSNFIAPGVEDEMRKLGVPDIDSMKKELYSRDFTMNTLLESLDFKSIYDITGEGVEDIKAGLIKCPINPMITIGVDPRRILRAIKFAVKYGFKIEDNLKHAILENRKKIQELPKKFVQDKMNEIVMIDDDAGIDKLIEYKLLPLVPLTKTISDILIQRRQLARAL